MAENNSLEIPIKFTLDAAAGQASVAQTEKIGAAQKKVNDDSERYQKRLLEMAREEHEAKVRAWEDAQKNKQVQDPKGGAADLSKTLDELKTSQAKATKETEDGTAADKEAFASKKELKEAVKGLREQFPMLGNIAHLVMNPIVLAASAASAAFGVWELKVGNLTRALGGIAMPDLKEADLERIGRFAERIKTLNESMAAAATSSAALNKALTSQVALINFLEKMKFFQGSKTGDSAEAATARAKNQTAAQLEAAAGEMKKKAGTPGSVEEESALRAQYAKAAAEAQKQKDEAQARLNDVLHYKETGDPITAAKLTARYFPTHNTDEAAAIERGVIESSQRIIDNYQRFEQQSGRRAGTRATITGAQGMEEEAARLRGEAGEAMRSDIVNRGGAAAGRGDAALQQAAGALDRMNLAELVQAVQRLAKAAVDIKQTVHDANAAAAALEQEVKTQGQRFNNRGQVP